MRESVQLKLCQVLPNQASYLSAAGCKSADLLNVLAILLRKYHTRLVSSD